MDCIHQLIPALSQILREEREKLGLSRTELAVRSNVSAPHIKAIEYSQRTPTITVFVLLASGLGIAPDALIKMVMQRQAYLKDKNA